MKNKMSWVVSGILMLSFTVIGSKGLITTFMHGWS
jgi:hypothetical protein